MIASDNLPAGGICRSSSLSTALMSRLSSGSPGVIAGPEWPGQVIRRVEPEPTLDLLCGLRVTFITMLLKDRTDLLLKEIVASIIGKSDCRSEVQQNKQCGGREGTGWSSALNLKFSALSHNAITGGTNTKPIV